MCSDSKLTGLGHIYTEASVRMFFGPQHFRCDHGYGVLMYFYMFQLQINCYGEI